MPLIPQPIYRIYTEFVTICFEIPSTDFPPTFWSIYDSAFQVDPNDPAKPLMVVHVPPLSTVESDLAEEAIKSEQISMERLLVHRYNSTRN